MTLVWHDWFATSDDGVGSSRLMIGQNKLFRRRALGSFEDLLLDVTRDPAMLVWLSGIENTKEAPNENYGRELMELFTLGAGRGYTERDVREQARALTGFRDDWDEGVGLNTFRFDDELPRRRHQADLRAARPLRLARRLPAVPAPPAHPAFFVTKLWSYFIPVAAGARHAARARAPVRARAATRCGRWSRRS